MMSGHAQGSACPQIVTCLHYYPKNQKIRHHAIICGKKLRLCVFRIGGLYGFHAVFGRTLVSKKSILTISITVSKGIFRPQINRKIVKLWLYGTHAPGREATVVDASTNLFRLAVYDAQWSFTF